MSTRYGSQGGSGYSGFDEGAETTTGVRRRHSEEEPGDPNFGGARGDYGGAAYGGSPSESGLQGGGGGSTPPRGGYAERTGGGRTTRRGGWSKNRTALLLGGLGVGGALVYVLGSGKSLRGRSRGGDTGTMVKCGEVMTSDPACCLPSDTVDRAAQLMRAEDVGPVPVVVDHQSKSLVGIVTDRDLALKVVADGRDPKATRVSDVMTTGVATCRREDDLQQALTLMERHQVRRIPVVDEGNRVVGIIAQADVATRVEAPQKTAEVVEEVSRASAAGTR